YHGQLENFYPHDRGHSLRNTPISFLRMVFSVRNRFNCGNNVCIVGKPDYQPMGDMTDGNDRCILFFQSDVFSRDHTKSIDGSRSAVKQKRL
ncbi:MAG: hypothetical protein ACLFST_15425, partial [Spirochaetia bacterium]